jgi:hypothetical protein
LPGERTIQYEARRHQLSRVVSQGATVQHRDSFLFPPVSLIRFEKSPDGELIRIAVDRASGGEGAPFTRPAVTGIQNGPAVAPTRLKPSLRTIQFEARLARDHRFQQK